jgi:hypothetical protein
MQHLYAIADGSDLYEIEGRLVTAFQQFIATWPVERVELVNKKAPIMNGQAIPDWNIGLHVEDPELRRSDVDQLLDFLLELSREVNLQFVVGAARRSWKEHTRDFCVVYRQVPDGAAGNIMEKLNAP